MGIIRAFPRSTAQMRSAKWPCVAARAREERAKSQLDSRFHIARPEWETRQRANAPVVLWNDDDELNINPPTPCQIGKRPSAPRKPKGKPGRPFVGADGGGSRRRPKCSDWCATAQGVSEVRSTRFPLIKNRAYQPRGRVVLEQFGHANFIFDVHFSRFGCFLGFWC